ncbi:MAG TPA: ABC transporter permease [Chitinophagales bacterium]|nr:ABC transporter permease [Chitinophagales bacterium]
MTLLAATQLELYKIFSRPRTYIAFAVIVVLVAAIQFGIHAEGQTMLDAATQNLHDTFDFSGNLLNGYFTSYMILNMLWVHVPFLVALVTGDLLSGEAASGTLRLLLTRSIGRTEWVIAKFIAAVIYSILLVLLLGALSLVLGKLLFGFGDLMVIRDTINILPEHDVLWRFFWAFGYGLLAMLVVAALSFFFSSLSDNSIGPIVGTMGVVIAFTVFTTLDVSIFRIMKPFLFTSYMGEWKSFFDFEPDYGKIIRSASVLAAHVVGLFLLTLLWFRRKDILT